MNGLIEQWGNYFQSINANYTVNLGVAYNSTTSYSIMLTVGVGDTSATMNYPLNYRAVDNNSFIITAGSAMNNTYLNWNTKGY